LEAQLHDQGLFCFSMRRFHWLARYHRGGQHSMHEELPHPFFAPRPHVQDWW